MLQRIKNDSVSSNGKLVTAQNNYNSFIQEVIV